MRYYVLLILTWLFAGFFCPVRAAAQDGGIPIYYRWAKSSYDPAYLGNSASVEALVKMVNSVGLDSIAAINITAYASPEGVYECNMQLSRERMRETRWLMKSKLPEAYGKMHFKMAGEAWFFLRARVAQDTRMTARSRDRVLRFLDDTGISDATRKWRLEHWLGSDPNVGDLYKYLLRTHYRYLRSAVFVTVVRTEPSEPAPVIADTTVVIAGSDRQSPADSVVAVAAEMPDQAGHDEKAAEAPVAPAKAPKQRLSLLGVSTNLLYDICYIKGYGLTSIPSFSLEYYPKQGHWTLGADVEWPMWQHYDTFRFLQINNITLWGRRYFKAREDEVSRYAGTYLLASANIARYGIGWDRKGWKGEALGISGGIGWKHYFGRSRFYFDTGVALGLLYSRYDPFVWGDDITDWFYYDYTGDPDEFHKRRMALTWLGPTRAYISIGFDITRLKK